MDCIDNLKVDVSICKKPCSGLIVTSISKSPLDKEEVKSSPPFQSYYKYKRITDFPTGYNGWCNILIYSLTFMS